MKLSTCVKKLRTEADLSTKAFGEALGVSHTAVVEWEHGKGISPFNRLRLLAFAKDRAADPVIVAVLEAAQEDLRP